ncbi:2215_t:CDS:2 [Funneliformis mosseae]|uniref:2215_t:CDS:1 n=1 Tax=Funneliformis mosseae TaxID=27381 RepID=A0A9N9AC55_FUNMO|nr:2215_t:CDS:2 [Funneliformis mosseae]
MVKKKSGRILNPADAHRKAMRQKEIKKNKAERRRVRTLVMVHKDTSKLEEEAHGVNLQKEKEKTTKEHVPVYFHPTLNPSGLPPPGVSVEDEKEGSFEDDSGSEFSDNDSEAEAKQESDEDIPLPPGSPPTKESDDELPELPPDLPPGPPPINISSYSPLMARPSHPSPFGFNHQGSPFPPPPGTFVFNGPLGSPNHQRPNMRTPPHPTFGPGPIPFSRGPPPPPTATMHPIQGQGYPVRSLDAPHPRPPPFSSQVSHYGPPPQIPGGNNNISSRTFSPSTISNNAQLAKASAATATPIIQAAPQVRNLQKELTTLIPTALLRKKVAASKPKVAIPVVNAAPKIDDGLISELSTVTPTKRSASTTIHLLQEQKSSEVDTSQSNGGMISNSAPPPTKKAKKKKADEYENEDLENGYIFLGSNYPAILG